MDGINQTIFVYGQTSSGKTFTMKGYNNDMGLIPLSVQELFGKIQNISDRKFQVSVSYIEIYNESVNDLIEPQNKNLDIRESITQGIYINKLSDNKASSFNDVMNFMAKGDEARNIASTKLNEHSSRSHTVFRINIRSEDQSGKIKFS